MRATISKNLKRFIVIFLIWIGYCVYESSQRGRYYHIDTTAVMDTHTGKIYIIKSGKKKIYGIY